MEKNRNPQAFIETDHGCIQVELYPEHAPETVKSFLWLASQGLLDNRKICRIVPGFVLQPSYSFFDDERCSYMIRGEFAANGYDNPVPFQRVPWAWAATALTRRPGAAFTLPSAMRPEKS